MRIFAQYLAVVIGLSFFAADALAAKLEYDTDRPGGDYRNFDHWGPEPSHSYCTNACNAEAQCKAWTWVRPAGPNQPARCWLKSTVPAAVSSSCCVSGVKELVLQPIIKPGLWVSDPGYDRPGGTYKTITLSKNAGAWNCWKHCKDDNKCKAWSWVKAGVQAPSNPVCSLKNTVPPKKSNKCCVSGVK